MNTYLYMDSDTAIHRLDPRTKLLILIVTFITAVLFVHPLYVLPVTCLVLLQTCVAGCISNVFRIRFLLLIISVFSIGLWAFYADGPRILFWGVSIESVYYGTGVAMKLTTMLVAGVAFLSTTRNEDITQGMIRLKIPYSFSFAFSTALRLLPTLIGTAQNVVQAQKSRGLDLDSGNIFERTKKHIPLLVPLFLTSIRSTDQLAMALDTKGFNSSTGRTFIHNLKFTNQDWIVSMVTLGFLIACIWLKTAGYGGIPGLVLTA